MRDFLTGEMPQPSSGVGKRAPFCPPWADGPWGDGPCDWLCDGPCCGLIGGLACGNRPELELRCKLLLDPNSPPNDPLCKLPSEPPRDPDGRRPISPSAKFESDPVMLIIPAGDVPSKSVKSRSESEIRGPKFGNILGMSSS